MNTMNDDLFFDLAMKVIANQATDAERAELDALLAAHPELDAELARLRTAAAVAKEALPLVEATEATAGAVPAYARGRLQTKVRQTLGRPARREEQDGIVAECTAWLNGKRSGATDAKLSSVRYSVREKPETDSERVKLGETVTSVRRDRSTRWRWIFGLTAAMTVILAVLIPALHSPHDSVIQIAMLDLGGATRGSDTNDVALLGQTWNNATVASFTASDELQSWEADWSAGNKSAIKIIYDRAAGEVRVVSWKQGKTLEKTFPVERDLAATLKQVHDYIAVIR